jgi:hypothetical protein
VKNQAKLLSNEFKTVSIHQHEDVLIETNMNRGYGLDPLDLLIRLEELAEDRYARRVIARSRSDYIRDERNRRVDLI